MTWKEADVRYLPDLCLEELEKIMKPSECYVSAEVQTRHLLNTN
jgi:hypothetical protein